VHLSFESLIDDLCFAFLSDLDECSRAADKAALLQTKIAASVTSFEKVKVSTIYIWYISKDYVRLPHRYKLEHQPLAKRDYKERMFGPVWGDGINDGITVSLDFFFFASTTTRRRNGISASRECASLGACSSSCAQRDRML
jgi:hypothetical protein